jgi:hypothetical protein
MRIKALGCMDAQADGNQAVIVSDRKLLLAMRYEVNFAS